jgi:hypothetical protein
MCGARMRGVIAKGRGVVRIAASFARAPPRAHQASPNAALPAAVTMGIAATGTSRMASNGDHDRNATMLKLTPLAIDADALGEAVLLHDFEEARFRTYLLASSAASAGFAELAQAADTLSKALGSTDGVPKAGYGAGLLLVADALMSLGMPEQSAVPCIPHFFP